MSLLARLLLLIALPAAAIAAHHETEVLIDGEQGMDNFTIVGTANWAAVDGAIQATESEGGASWLVTKKAYDDFRVIVEFWASEDANSGIYMRCEGPDKIGDRTCYEANIYDQRPDPSYGTGAIVHIATAPEPRILAGGKWNTYEITLEGDHLQVVLNGVKTVDTRDSKLAKGPLALQWGQGTLRFRRVEITPL